MDRVADPYARFVMSHRLLMYGVYAVAIVLVWALVSKTLALVMIAVMVAAFLYGIASVMWQVLRERRRS